MPVLMVSENTSPHVGFSRNRSMRAVGPGDDDAELERVLDVLERDRRRRRSASRCAFTNAVRSMSVRTSPEMTRKRVVELVGRVAHRTGGAERRVLGRVPHGDTEVGAVAEVVADLVGEERDGHHDLVEAVQREQVDDVLHHRLVGQGHHRLGRVAGERTQAGALTAGEDDGLHETLPAAVGRPALAQRRARAARR